MEVKLKPQCHYRLQHRHHMNIVYSSLKKPIVSESQSVNYKCGNCEPSTKNKQIYGCFRKEAKHISYIQYIWIKEDKISLLPLPHIYFAWNLSSETLENCNAFWVMVSLALRCLNSILTGHLCLDHFHFTPFPGSRCIPASDDKMTSDAQLKW